MSAIGKNSKKGGAKQKRGEKKDLSKVRCYACNAFGHYAGQCLNKNRGKQEEEQVAPVAKIKSFTTKFEK